LVKPAERAVSAVVDQTSYYIFLTYWLRREAPRLLAVRFALRLGHGVPTALLDDMVLSVSTDALLQDIIARLQAEFAMKDMGPLRFFLGVDVQRLSTGFFLSQTKYAKELLDRIGMTHCKQATTPIDTKANLSSSTGAAVSDLPQHCQRTSVPHHHPSGQHRVHCAASLPPHA
jgi:hypothetical protein